MAKYRLNRLNEEMKREIAEVISGELKDPRLGFVSIVKVNAAADLKTAKVYVSHLGGNITESMDALKSSAGYIRRELSKRLTTRTVPELIFIADDSIEHGIRISKILDEVKSREDSNA